MSGEISCLAERPTHCDAEPWEKLLSMGQFFKFVGFGVQYHKIIDFEMLIDTTAVRCITHAIFGFLHKLSGSFEFHHSRHGIISARTSLCSRLAGCDVYFASKREVLEEGTF